MHLRIGSRTSALAVTQAREVQLKIEKEFPNITSEIITIKTSGDIHKNAKLSDIGGKGLFIRELEFALKERTIDIAVHSMKDIPSVDNKDLTIPCTLKRLSPYDVFISQKFHSISEMKPKNTIGTSSIRREKQILDKSPGVRVLPIRGNIDTRLKKMDQYDGLILAHSAMIRMNYHSSITEVLSAEYMLPAANQGIVCAQCLSENFTVVEILKTINHIQTFALAKAERTFLVSLNGSCTTPAAAFAELLDNDTQNLHLRCLLFVGNTKLTVNMSGSIADAEKIGADAGMKMRNLANMG